MTTFRIVAIVEGHGECKAVPVLIRRVAQTVDPALVLEIPHIRIPASKLVRNGEIERAVELAARKLGGLGGVLVLVDCDDGCPAVEGPALLARAKSAHSDLPIAVVLAKKEFEAWFLAAAVSLRGHRGLPSDLLPPADPEAIRGAKGWLTRHMPEGRIYSETEDQAALTAVFDIETARTADSFDKFFREIDRMLRQLQISNVGNEGAVDGEERPGGGR
jgi:hypothetical protein